MDENLSWTSEFSQSFKNLKDLYQFLEWKLSPDLLTVAETYPLFIPRSLAMKIKNDGPDGVLAREFLPDSRELDPTLNLMGLEDPIGDKEYFKAPQLIHRYNSRALFAPTVVCPVHCRYCFRKNELSANEELFQHDFLKTLEYLKDHPQISEIIFTGGDPLTLSNEKLEKYLMAFSEIKSIKDIRFHTRYPVILPERIDTGLLIVLSNASEKFRTISIAIHANHAKEFDSQNQQAIRKLSQLNLQLLSQSVLLSGVNDSHTALMDLINEFLDLKIRPYYLHHTDQVKGGMHFYVSLQRGRELYQALRSELPGWALPQYVIDLPGGHGKVSAFNPESPKFSGHFLSRSGQPIPLIEPDLFI
jgi:lysine 2,3-aminomutase